MVAAVALIGLIAARGTSFAQTFEVVTPFGPGTDGQLRHGFIQATDGNFYGTTPRGGIFGTVFKMDAAAGTLTTLHSFGLNSVGLLPEGTTPTGLIQGTDGSFYGTMEGGGLVEVPGFGTTNGSGTLFRMDAAGMVTVLHVFSPGLNGNTTEGGAPQGLIQASDGSFYGTTLSGPIDFQRPINGQFVPAGTVFKIDAGGTQTTLHTFSGSDGAKPTASLIQATDGNFYGTTSEDNVLGFGTVFKMTPAGTLTTLHTFSGSDGANPFGPLVQGADGNFYGTTFYGGSGYTGPLSGSGTVFKIDTAGTLTTLHRFTVGEGRSPYAGLIQGTDGNFYGTTTAGGVPGGSVTVFNMAGTVFKMDAAGTVTTLHTFSGSDGERPFAGLVQARDGSIYGATETGGANFTGVVFRLRFESDSTPPEISCGHPDATWHATNVAILCTASDPESGLANPADASFSLTTTVPNGTETAFAATGNRQVCNTAGLCATAGPIGGNMVDRKAPTIVINSPAANATYGLNAFVGAAYTCADGGSGVGPCFGPVANGAAIDTSTLGPKGFSVTSMDAVGNQSTSTVSYNVVRNVVGSTDLSITLQGASKVAPNQTLTYSMTVHNAGPGIAAGVVVVDALPSGTVFASASASQGVVEAPAVGSTGTVTAKLGSLASGASASITLGVTVIATSGSFTDTATVTSTTPDSNPKNNVASQKTTVSKK
jgi:uncharacterized repeat protein (TIGR01451 family)